MTTVVRIVKWLLLLAAAAWAYHVHSFYMLLARAFPVTEPSPGGLAGLVATLQAYAVALVPLTLAALLLLVKWPERRKA